MSLKVHLNDSEAHTNSVDLFSSISKRSVHSNKLQFCFLSWSTIYTFVIFLREEQHFGMQFCYSATKLMRITAVW
jgi:hypothetical protein